MIDLPFSREQSSFEIILNFHNDINGCFVDVATIIVFIAHFRVLNLRCHEMFFEFQDGINQFSAQLRIARTHLPKCKI